MYDHGTMTKLGQMLAKFHAMKPPIENHHGWLQRYLLSDLDHVWDTFLADNKPLLERYDCKALLNCDLKAEIRWLTERIPGFESPVVFSHNDFRMQNILMSDHNGIVLSDFDYSVYGYRGYDFSWFFMQFEKRVENMFEFKDESVVRQFIGSYVKQCEQIYGTEYYANPINSVQHIITETKRFLLGATMNSTIIMIKIGANFPINEQTRLVSLL